jgi:hypothetical protein
MRLLVPALLLLVASGASAQGVARVRSQPETIFTTRFTSAAATATTTGMVVLKAGFRVERVTTGVNVISGGGAGTTVFRASDGTNNCDCTMLCAGATVTASGSTGGKDIACTGSCSFAAGANVTTNIAASTCTTTQPTLLNVDFRGRSL